MPSGNTPEKAIGKGETGSRNGFFATPFQQKNERVRISGRSPALAVSAGVLNVGVYGGLKVTAGGSVEKGWKHQHGPRQTKAQL